MMNLYFLDVLISKYETRFFGRVIVAVLVTRNQLGMGHRADIICISPSTLQHKCGDKITCTNSSFHDTVTQKCHMTAINQTMATRQKVMRLRLVHGTDSVESEVSPVVGHQMSPPSLVDRRQEVTRFLGTELCVFNNDDL